MKLLVYFLVCLSCIFCERDFRNNVEDSKESKEIYPENLAMAISYDVETQSFRGLAKGQDDSKLSKSDEIAMIPIKEKDNFNLQVYKDGSFRQEITQIYKREVALDEEVPRSQTPETVRTVWQNDNLTGYDKDGKLTFSSPLKQNKQHYKLIIRHKRGEELKPEDFMSLFPEREDDYDRKSSVKVNISKEVEDHHSKMGRKIISGEGYVSLVDTVNNKLLRYSTLDPNGKMASNISYRYNKRGNITNSIETRYDKNVNGLKFRNEIMKQYTNIKSVNNIKKVKK